MLNTQIFKKNLTAQSLHAPLQDYSIISANRKNRNLKDLLVRADLGTGPDNVSPVAVTFFSAQGSVDGV